jgi:steroid delta-isomerase-like uncharacterized protein
MTKQNTKALVRRFVEAMNARQLDALDELMAPDFVRHCQATPDLDIRSREQFKDFLRWDATVFPDSVQTLRHVVADGNLVGVWATYAGTQRGHMGPFPPSGKKAKVELGAILRIEAGKIAEVWVIWDNLVMLGQLGHLPDLQNANVGHGEEGREARGAGQ